MALQTRPTGLPDATNDNIVVFKIEYFLKKISWLIAENGELPWKMAYHGEILWNKIAEHG